MLTFAVVDDRLELTASGYIAAEESAAVLKSIRENPAVPDRLGLLVDIRQHDHMSMTPDEVNVRLTRMFEVLGPKVGPHFALVVDEQIGQIMRGRLVQELMQHAGADVMVFHDVDEAREWLTVRRARP